jgi:hypothetical protein
MCVPHMSTVTWRRALTKLNLKPHALSHFCDTTAHRKKKRAHSQLRLMTNFRRQIDRHCGLDLDAACDCQRLHQSMKIGVLHVVPQGLAFDQPLQSTSPSKQASVTGNQTQCGREEVLDCAQVSVITNQPECAVEMRCTGGWSATCKKEISASSSSARCSHLRISGVGYRFWVRITSW